MELQVTRKRLKRRQMRLMAVVDMLDGDIGGTLGVRDQLYYALKRIVRKYEDSKQQPPFSRGCWIVVMLHMERHVDEQIRTTSPALNMPALMERVMQLKWYRYEQAQGASSNGLTLSERWVEAVREIDLPLIQNFRGVVTSTPIRLRQGHQYKYSVDYVSAGAFLRSMFREDLLTQDQEITGPETAVAQSGSADSPDATSTIATDPRFLGIATELRTVIHEYVLTLPNTGIYFKSTLSGVQGHAYNAAADPLTQKRTGNPFEMMAEQQWKPDSRATGILGHYHTLIALLCVNKQIYNEAKPLFYANHFVFGSMPAFDKLLRKQSQAILAYNPDPSQTAFYFTPPIASLR
nr:hypothetical protein B0A51_18535 [Rachicladosporium sp. CCFEE 5018]